MDTARFFKVFNKQFRRSLRYQQLCYSLTIFRTSRSRLFASMWNLPSRDDYWYMTACGTESNMYGILLDASGFQMQSFALVKSHITLFSKLLNFIECARVLLKLKIRELDYDDLERVLRANADVEIVLNVNIGTTVKGAVDRMSRVSGY